MTRLDPAYAIPIVMMCGYDKFKSQIQDKFVHFGTCFGILIEKCVVLIDPINPFYQEFGLVVVPE